MRRCLAFVLLLPLVALSASCNPGGPRNHHKTHTTLTEIDATDYPLVVRTDFSDNHKWDQIIKAIKRTSRPGGFEAYVDFCDSSAFSGLDTAALTTRITRAYDHGFIFVCDAQTISNRRPVILVIDLDKTENPSFRALPEYVQAIENNLSIANMDWADFTTRLDAEGVFKGF